MFKDMGLANWFLQKGIDRGNALTQMQLQKLVYFAHALSLASNNKPLTLGSFQAWEYGPVLPDLYEHTRHWGRKPITEPIAVPGDNLLSLSIPRADEASIPYLKSTWDTFSQYDALTLSKMSHEKGSPWSAIFCEGKRLHIPNYAIAEFYSSRVIKND